MASWPRRRHRCIMAGSGNFLILGGSGQWFIISLFGLDLFGWCGREVFTTMLYESRPMRADAGLSAGLASTMIQDQLCSRHS